MRSWSYLQQSGARLVEPVGICHDPSLSGDHNTGLQEVLVGCAVDMPTGHRPHVSCFDAKSSFQSSGTSSRVLCVCPQVYHQFFFVLGSLSVAPFIEHS